MTDTEDELRGQVVTLELRVEELESQLSLAEKSLELGKALFAAFYKAAFVVSDEFDAELEDCCKHFGVEMEQELDTGDGDEPAKD